MTPARTSFAHVLAVASLALFTGIGCGNFDRNNPVDPFVNGGASLSEQLIGTWSREDGSQAQDYLFSQGQGVTRVDYAAVTTGAAVDRLGAWPGMRVHTFQGIFELRNGNELVMTFSSAHSNDPAESLTPPPVSQVVTISISRNTLTTVEAGSTLLFVRLRS